MISDFKIFLIMLLRQLSFSVLTIKQLFFVYHKGKTQLSFNLQLLLLLSDEGLSPESCFSNLPSEGSLLINWLPIKKV